MKKALYLLVPCIVLLTIAAILGGLWPVEGTPFEAVTVRGEKVMVNGRGLYYWDTVSSVAQMQANDLITLAVAVPLLIVSFILALRGSLRGKMVLSGASLYALILAMLSFDLESLPGRFSPKLPRAWIAGLLFFAAAFLLLAWSGRIAAAYASAAAPSLENTTSMFIQAMDLAIIVPLCLVSGILLLRKSPWGYLLASVGLVKFSMLGMAVSLMAVNMVRNGVAVSPVELLVFPAMSLFGVAMTVVLLLGVSPAGTQS